MPQYLNFESLIDFDLEVSFGDLDYPGVEIAARFVELDIYLNKLDEVVPFVREQALLRMRAEIDNAANAMSEMEKEDKIDEIEWVADDVVPRYFIGAFVIALAAAYEGAVIRVANYLRRKSKSPLQIGDLRETSIGKRLSLYLATVLGEPFVLSEGLAARIDELIAVRNCLAHANGDLSHQSTKRIAMLERIAKESDGVTIRNQILLVDMPFARTYLQYAVDAINSLLGLVHRRLAAERPSPTSS